MTNEIVRKKFFDWRINITFLLVVSIPCAIVYALVDTRTPLQLCQESYMKATNEISTYNIENPKYKLTLPVYDCNDEVTSSWTHSTGITVPPERHGEKLSRNSPLEDLIEDTYILEPLWLKVCKKQINSPLCKDRKLFDRLYQLTEERLPWKNFFPILIGMTNAESSLWLDFAKDNVWWRCNGRNNWGWAKYQILDDNSRVYKRNLNGFDYKYPRDQFDCNLFPFESIEEYWISKVNGIRYWYKWCVDHKSPIWCISWAYVGSPSKHEQGWISNVSSFLI